MRDAHVNPVGRLEASVKGQNNQVKDDLKCNGWVPSDNGDGMSSDTESLSFGDSSNTRSHGEDGASSIDAFSPLGGRLKEDYCLSRSPSVDFKPVTNGFVAFWEEKTEGKGLHLSGRPPSM